jgi:hypothetical protein
MRTIAGIFMATMMVASATTLEILEVFQPVSLHGTDVVAEFEGEAVQARVMARPLVLTGAMPETLVAAVGTPLQLPATLNYAVPECNLLALCGIGISGTLERQSKLVVSLDLSKSRIPEGVELPIRTVLKLSLAAIKQTLMANHHGENRKLQVKVELIGLSEKTASLEDLQVTFVIPGR